MATASDFTECEVVTGGRPRRRVVRWPAQVPLVIGLVALLWSASYPVVAAEPLALAAVALIAAGLAWLAAVVVAGVRAVYGTGSRVRPGLSFLVGPVGVIIAVSLLAVEVPREARWAQSRASFEAVADDAQPGLARTQHRTLDDGALLGTYRVGHIYQQGAAVIFYVDAAGFLDDGGFAYLPEGPFPELANEGFEDPKFTSLGGGWYRWTASW